ncbi:MAG TPA: PPC domain-containing protein, partial [Pirellulaceae bacterium]|nr:PPC domain-containing protein [Pirellulaceae bacterium]
VETVIEAEPAGMAPPGRNGSAQTAQYLGSLGAYEKAGDENLRLGFTVNGAVGATSDVDVYSFTAKPGTRVWLDIDRTTQSLDTVLELVDDDGVILAQSDNSAAEGDGLSNVYEAAGVNASPLTDNGPFAVPDRWTMNPRDAGMSVVLPGQGDVNTYHVRVRSSNLKSGDPSSKLLDPAQVGGGLTSGVYQLQIRLRELDEIGGTTVRYADIRYAQNGITVQGQPTHSPLLGEASEREAVSGVNDTFNNAQGLGNLLTSDRGVASVAGNLGLGTDVDWYRLDVTYSELEAATTAMIGAAFDIDYADGMARPDTMMSVFDSNGRLIYTSTDSNIGDDRPQPLGG